MDGAESVGTHHQVCVRRGVVKLHGGAAVSRLGLPNRIGAGPLRPTHAPHRASDYSCAACDMRVSKTLSDVEAPDQLARHGCEHVWGYAGRSGSDGDGVVRPMANRVELLASEKELAEPAIWKNEREDFARVLDAPCPESRSSVLDMLRTRWAPRISLPLLHTIWLLSRHVGSWVSCKKTTFRRWTTDNSVVVIGPPAGVVQ